MSRTVRDLESPQNTESPTIERIVAAAMADHMQAQTPGRLAGRALFVRRVAPVGYQAPRSADEQAQKLSGRALMIARQKNGGRQLGASR